MGAANRGGVLEDFSRQYPASKLNVGDEKEMNETNSKSSDELCSQAARAQLEVSELERDSLLIGRHYLLLPFFLLAFVAGVAFGGLPALP